MYTQAFDKILDICGSWCFMMANFISSLPLLFEELVIQLLDYNFQSKLRLHMLVHTIVVEMPLYTTGSIYSTMQ